MNFYGLKSKLEVII